MQTTKERDTFRHTVFAEKVVKLDYQALYFVVYKRKVKTFEFTENFGRKDIVDRFRFRTATRFIYGDECLELFDDTVTERNTEMFYDVQVEFFYLFKQFLADGVAFDRLFVKTCNVRITYSLCFDLRCFELNALTVEIDDESTVVNLVGNGEGGVVVVGGTDVPNVLRNL